MEPTASTNVEHTSFPGKSGHIPFPLLLMSTAHEAFRLGFSDIRAIMMSLDDDESAYEKLADSLSSLKRCLDVHRIQEDQCLFPLVVGSEIAPAVIEDLKNEHRHDLEEMSNVWIAMESFRWGRIDMAELCDEVENWMQYASKHLAHEEKVLSAGGRKVFASVTEEIGFFRRLIDLDRDAFRDDHIRYIAEVLARHGQFKLLGRFAVSMRLVARPEEYAGFRSTVLDAVGPVFEGVLTNTGLI